MDNSPPDDYENTVCPFGIHSISQEAKQYLRMDAGQWYGPQRISLVLRNICNRQRPINQFRIYVCLEGYIFLDEIDHLLDKQNSVLILMPVMVGADKITQTCLN